MNHNIIDRIKSTSLTFNKDKCYYKDKLFSGVAVVINPDNGIISSMIEYNKGKQVGDYHNDFFDYSGKVVMDEDYLDCPDDYQYFVDGKFFNGVGIEFIEDFCCGETEYIDGLPNNTVINNRNGQIVYLEFYLNEVDQSYTFNQSHAVEKADISYHGSKFEMDMTENNHLRYLEIDNGYFTKIQNIKISLLYPEFASRKKKK